MLNSRLCSGFRILLLSLGVTLANTCFADTALISFDNIQGEVRHPELPGEASRVLSWSWSASNGGSAQVGGGGSTSGTCVENFIFTKEFNPASVDLLKALIKGYTLGRGTFFIENDQRIPVLRIDFERIRISRIDDGGIIGAAPITQKIAFTFEEFQMSSYSPDGAATEAIYSAQQDSGSCP